MDQLTFATTNYRSIRDRIHAELRRRGVTLALLWQDYRGQHPDGYGYSRFCDLYGEWRRGVTATMRQTHAAGEKLFVDFAGAVLLAHDEVEMARPGPVVAAELGVLVAVGLALLVFHVQQLEGHALSSQLAMDRRPVGQRPARRWRRLRPREQAGLELCVVHAVGQRPAETGLERADQVVGHGGVGQARGRPGRAATQALAEGEAEDLADLAHGGTGAWHRHRSSNG